MSDPFEKAKLIRKGELDNQMPDYEELTGWLQRVPTTGLPGLLNAAVYACVVKQVFQPSKLVEFVKKAEVTANNHASMLRGSNE